MPRSLSLVRLVGTKFRPPFSGPDSAALWQGFVDKMRLADGGALLNRLVEYSQNMDVYTEIRISRANFRIVGMESMFTRSGELIGTTRMSWSPDFKEVPRGPEKWINGAPLGIAELLLLNVNSIGGWVRKTHCTWSQESLRLLETADTTRRYAEVYSANWYSATYSGGTPEPFKHHPIILGAHY